MEKLKEVKLRLFEWKEWATHDLIYLIPKYITLFIILMTGILLIYVHLNTVVRKDKTKLLYQPCMLLKAKHLCDRSQNDFIISKDVITHIYEIIEDFLIDSVSHTTGSRLTYVDLVGNMTLRQYRVRPGLAKKWSLDSADLTHPKLDASLSNYTDTRTVRTSHNYYEATPHAHVLLEGSQIKKPYLKVREMTLLKLYKMEKSQWVDKDTRAVILQYGLYERDTGSFIHLSYIFEKEDNWVFSAHLLMGYIYPIFYPNEEAIQRTDIFYFHRENSNVYLALVTVFVLCNLLIMLNVLYIRHLGLFALDIILLAMEGYILVMSHHCGNFIQQVINQYGDFHKIDVEVPLLLMDNIQLLIISIMYIFSVKLIMMLDHMKVINLKRRALLLIHVFAVCTPFLLLFCGLLMLQNGDLTAYQSLGQVLSPLFPFGSQVGSHPVFLVIYFIMHNIILVFMLSTLKKYQKTRN